MCGVTGFVDFTSNSSEKILKAMTSSLQHRGPDGNGHYFKQADNFQIGLGHTRLSIIDLSTTAGQPMSFDGLYLIFNGEIYNYNEIRDELIKLGHQFVTQSDTEVVLHSWKQWGIDGIHKWIGMFVVIIYDEKAHKVTAIRDRAGVKPFYYTLTDNLFVWSSELKAICQHPGFKKEIDPNAVASFLQYGYVSHPHCIYKNTFKLPPGHLLTLDLEKPKASVSQYWNVYDYYNKPKLSISLPEAINETERILEKAFQYRLVADVPVGVFLSGGYDSTCVTALLQKSSKTPLRTFTIGMVENKLDEAVFAKQIAAHLNTDHTEYYCTSKEALEIIPTLPFFYDEPFGDSSAIPTMLVSKMARKDVTVALSADAGDEIFAGYFRYDYVSKFGKTITAIPEPVRKAIVKTMRVIPSEKVPFFNKKSNFHGRYDKVKNLLNDPSTAELMKNLTRAFTDLELSQLFIKPIDSIHTSHSSHELLSTDGLDFMMAIDYQTYLVDDILQKVDRATMSVSLEGREPFLDQNIIEWAATLPSSYKYHQGNKKHILKQIVHKYIPKELMDRPKMGFSIPIERWLNNELKDLVLTTLNSKSLARHGLFNVTVVDDILNKFYSGRTEKHLQIWYLLMFQMWYDRWY